MGFRVICIATSFSWQKQKKTWYFFSLAEYDGFPDILGGKIHWGNTEGESSFPKQADSENTSRVKCAPWRFCRPKHGNGMMKERTLLRAELHLWLSDWVSERRVGVYQTRTQKERDAHKHITESNLRGLCRTLARSLAVSEHQVELRRTVEEVRLLLF